jgi:hypothetical protein
MELLIRTTVSPSLVVELPDDDKERKPGNQAARVTKLIEEGQPVEVYVPQPTGGRTGPRWAVINPQQVVVVIEQ